jgi:hypothetical protein
MTQPGLYLRRTACLLVCCTTALIAAQDPPADREKELHRQWLASLRAVFDAQRKLCDDGHGPPADLLEAARQLFLAQLEGADKPADRRALCERFAAQLKAAREATEARRQAGRLTDTGYALARAAYFDDEVMLARERLRARPSKEADTDLHTLLLDRREAYRAALMHLHADFKAGRGDLGPLLETSHRSLRAEAEVVGLARDPVHVRQVTVDQLRKLEDLVQEWLAAGKAGASSVAEVRIARLSVEIDVVRLKAKEPNKSAQVQKLLRERRAAARELIRALRELHQLPGVDRIGDQQAMLKAVQLQLETELALAEKPADRVTLWRAHVDWLKKAEKEAQARVQAGRDPQVEYERLHAVRLAAEINLVRAERNRSR